MPSREKRLRLEANRLRREEEARRAQRPGDEERPVEHSEPADVPDGGALDPEQLLQGNEEMAPESLEPANQEDALREMIQGLTSEQATLLGRLLAAQSPPSPQDPPPPLRPLAARPDTSAMMWVRFAIPGLGYFTYHGTNYDRGQLMPLAGGPRDEQLVRLGYVQPIIKDEAYLQAQCGVCGLWFLNEQFRDMHGRARHSERFVSDLDIGGGMEGPDGGAALRDVTGDAEERQMQQRYPLFLDRTKATLESSQA